MSNDAKTSARKTAKRTPKVEVKAAQAAEQGEAAERKFAPNPETEAFRGAINDAGRMAAYAAEAIVPKTARNRKAEVARARKDLSRDALAEIIGSGKHTLPDRPKSHLEHAAKDGELQLS
jgi:hypothetical protein